MILATYTKQPDEVLDYDIDFSDFLDDGDSLATTGDPKVPNPLDVVVTPVDAFFVLGDTFVIGDSDLILKQWVSGGVVGVTYKIEITATTGRGRVKQVEFKVRIKEY